MASTLPDRSAALEQARALHETQDYPALVAAVSALPDGELLAEPELGVLLAVALRRVGESGRALELVRALARPCKRRGNDRLRRRRLNLEGMLLFEQGDVYAAEAVWLELIEASAPAADEEYVAHANNNLGVICTLHGRQEEALACYERAMLAYQRLGNRRGLAQAHHNLGIAYGELGYVREAEAHLRQAIALARADGSEDEVARSEQERALLFFLRGDAPLAEATARRALERFVRLGDQGGAGLARRVLGTIALGESRYGEARELLEQALAVARQVRDALLEAETLEALAALEAAEGDEAAAAARCAAADQAFHALGAAKWGERVRSRLDAIRQGPAARAAIVRPLRRP